MTADVCLPDHHHPPCSLSTTHDHTQEQRMGKGEKAAKRKSLEDEELTRVVFGEDVFKGLGQSTDGKRSKQSTSSGSSSSSSSSSIDFHVDRTGDNRQSRDELGWSIGGETKSIQALRKGQDSTNSTAVWHDDDDDKVEINLNLTDRLKKLKKKDSNVISGTELSQTLKER